MASQDKTLEFEYTSTLDRTDGKPATQKYTLGYDLVPPEHHEGQTVLDNDKDLPTLLMCHPFNNSRHYWSPQTHDHTLGPFNKVAVDSIGFALSSTDGRQWDFDLAAHAIIQLVDELGVKAVIIGDSMGGGPIGLRVALLDAKRRSKKGATEPKGEILGVVACGTCAEEESADFVEQYLASASAFAKTCLTIPPFRAITDFATDMSMDGYGLSHEPLVLSARLRGAGIISKSLSLTLGVGGEGVDGKFDPKEIGRRMKMNYQILCGRKGLIGELAARPSRLGKRKVLVVHGTEDEAYPFNRNYHTRTVSAIGEENASLHVVQGGPHFVTVTHWPTLDKTIDEWIRGELLGQEVKKA
ncbi:alpha/beta-hydrolase [Meredithblackwellia eburnea MCA 4105]